jgi:hypothetical protein
MAELAMIEMQDRELFAAMAMQTVITRKRQGIIRNMQTSLDFCCSPRDLGILLRVTLAARPF